MEMNSTEADVMQLEVSESFEHSPSIGLLIEALAAASLKFEPAFKEGKNPTYQNSRYAPLEILIAATRDALSAHGLALIQMPSLNGKNVEVTTLLAHQSGEWISSKLALPGTMRERFDAQSCGSGITYARRYALQSILNIAGEVDDDGNAAVGAGTKEAAQAVAKAKIADYKEKAPASVSNKTLVLHAKTQDGMAVLVFERNEAMALMVDQTQIGDFTNFSKELGGRYFADTPDNMILLTGAARPLGITIERQDAVKSLFPIIISAEEKVTKKHAPYLSVQWGEQTVSCFDTELCKVIASGVGQAADFTTSTSKDGKYVSISGIKRIGDVEYDENGPVIQQSQR